MRRIHIISVLIFAAVACVSARAADRPPNIVLLLADDLGYNDISLHGNTLVRTPNIDSIGKGGVQFTRGHTTAPVCSPSRAGLLTGRNQQRFGFEFVVGPPQMFIALAGGPERLRASGSIMREVHPDQQIPPSEMGIPRSQTNIAEMLKLHGYATGIVGKWHVGEGPDFSPPFRGFDHATWASQVLYGREDDAAMIKAKLPWDPIDAFLWSRLGFSINRGGTPFSPEEDMTTFQARDAIRFIEANKDDPFFLYVPFFAPHTPLQAPKEFYDRLDYIEDHKTRVYYAMIECLDNAVGLIMDKLKELGLEDNTLVIFSSDNGAAEYTRIPNTNQPFRGSKLTYYQGGVVVPLLMRWPAGLAAGQVFHKPVSLTDVYPTVAAAAGAALPEGETLDGVNLIPYVKGEAQGDPHQSLVWRGGETKAVLSGEYRLQIDGLQNRTVLYNIKDDVGERENLAESRPEIAERLQMILERAESNFMRPRWVRPFASRRRIDIWPGDPPADAEYTYF